MEVWQYIYIYSQYWAYSVHLVHKKVKFIGQNHIFQVLFLQASSKISSLGHNPKSLI